VDLVVEHLIKVQLDWERQVKEIMEALEKRQDLLVEVAVEELVLLVLTLQEKVEMVELVLFLP
jgi:hypothetical protein